MIYSDEQVSACRSTSIAGVLASLGYKTQHTARGMYFSPFRDERTPSFFINDNEHYWIDYGEIEMDGKPHRHDVFDLLYRLKDMSFVQSLEYLSGWSPGAEIEEVIKSSQSTSTGSIKVLDIKQPITKLSLADYAINTRRISPGVLNRYCYQIEYSTEYVDKNTGEFKTFTSQAIGFPNRGGWVLRMPSRKNPSCKRSTGAGFTFIHADGRIDDADTVTPTSDTLVLFEGMFNFFSWLEKLHREIPLNADVIVLNSVNNVSRALDTIVRYSTVECFLDNDVAGDNCTQVVVEAVRNAATPESPRTCNDRRSLYANHNDLNDEWLDACERYRREKASQAKPSMVEESASKGVRP